MVKGKKDASENVPQPAISKSIIELLNYYIILNSTSNMQININDGKKADLIEKCNYSSRDQIVVIILKRLTLLLKSVLFQ